MNPPRKIMITLALAAGLGLTPAGTADAAVIEAGPALSVVADDPIPSTMASDTGQNDDALGQGEGAADPVLSPFTAASVNYGGTITRANVLKRAKNWYTRNVPYNQGATAWDINHGKRYRTDCSGFASMSWALTSSRTTSTLSGVSKKIAWSSLKPGDIVLRKGHHVQLFEKWANSAHTRFWIYEEGSTASDMNHYRVYVSTAKSNGYLPYRYNKIK